MIEHVYIGFGANLGDRHANFASVIRLLRGRARVLRVANLVESLPVDGVEGGTFLNTVIECERHGGPHDFMLMLQQIELEVGAANDKLGGARTCDLDILLWGESVIDLPDLRVPHPRMHLRDFYLVPLCELISAELHPVRGVSFAQLLADVDLHSVVGAPAV